LPLLKFQPTYKREGCHSVVFVKGYERPQNFINK